MCTRIKSSLRNWAGMTRVPVAPGANSNKCCMMTGRYDGSQRNHYSRQIRGARFSRAPWSRQSELAFFEAQQIHGAAIKQEPIANPPDYVDDAERKGSEHFHLQSLYLEKSDARSYHNDKENQR